MAWLLIDHVAVLIAVVHAVDSLNIGVNLPPITTDGWGVSEWRMVGTRVFLDLFKHATNWQQDNCCGDDAGIQTARVNATRHPVTDWQHYGIPTNKFPNFTAGGYPASLETYNASNQPFVISAVAHIGKGGAFVKSGLYVCLFDGDGSISFEKDATLVSFATDASSTAVGGGGRYVVSVTAQAGVRLRLMATNPTNPLRNIRLFPAAVEQASTPLTDAFLAAHPFHPDLLEAIRPLKVLRFCDWQRYDANFYNPNNKPNSFASRPKPTDPTQAGTGGVALEYMLQLANELSIPPWFCQPEPADAADAFITNFATQVRDGLASGLQVYVEYRQGFPDTGSMNRNAAINSLTVWNIWEAVFGSAGSSRLVNVAAESACLGCGLDTFGSDLVRVEAVALQANFGTLCTWGWKKCVGFTDDGYPESPGGGFPDATVAYSSLSVDQLLAVVRMTVLRAENELNQKVQYVQAKGLRIITSSAGPNFGAAGYGHRASLEGARRCRQCLQTTLGRKEGPITRAASLAQGYVTEADWGYLTGYEGIHAGSRALVYTGPDGDSNPSLGYWRHVGSNLTACRDVCDAAGSACAGFAHHKAGEWACGRTTHATCPGEGTCYDRYGKCSQPGTCYFFAAPKLDQYGTAAAPAGTRDVYFKASVGGLVSEASAATSCAGSCQFFYNVEFNASTWTLDGLANKWPWFVDKAAQEQTLENKLIEVNNHPTMTELLLDFMERWRVLGGDLLVAQSLWAAPARCTSGGKGCGHHGLMMHPDDARGAKLLAVQQYNAGRRSTLPFVGAPAALAVCSPACVWGTCFRDACQCFAGYTGPTCSVVTAKVNDCGRSALPVGINLGGISDWTSEWDFVDVFRQSRAWINQEFSSYKWSALGQLQLGPNGYPTRLAPNQKATTLTVRDRLQRFPSGTFVVLYEGDGTLGVGMDVTAVRRTQPGRIEVDVALSTGMNNGLTITIERTNPANPVRNIRVAMPGFEERLAAMPFHPAFLKTLERYQILRFAGWARANDAVPGEWSLRNTPQGGPVHSYALGGGVPVESMVALANWVGAAPWFSLPFNATDEHLTQFATVVRDTLRPDVQIYVELSNEMWHTGFESGRFAQQQAVTAGLSTLCWVVRRSKALSQAWQAVFGSQARSRLVFVVQTQVSNPDATRQILACPDLGSAGQYVDAIGIAPYMDGCEPTMTTVSAVLDAFQASLRDIALDLAQHSTLTSPAGFPLVTYEAGPGGQGDGTDKDLCIVAHRADRMRSIVKEYYNMLEAAGVKALLHFVSAGLPSKYGSWGLIESTDQPPTSAVKQQGLFDYLDQHSSCSYTSVSSSCPSSNQCSGAGHCLPAHLRVDGNECSCYYGKSGSTCNVTAYVDYKACGYQCTFDQGLCLVNQTFDVNRYWSCQCLAPYFGATCSQFQCQNGCNYNGHCIDQDVCSCFRGFKGDSCDIDCGCGGHGQCKADNTCVCDVGWRSVQRSSGPTCEWNCATVDQSQGCSGPGQSGCAACRSGTCVNGLCKCWAGYSGVACDDPVAVAAAANAASPIGLNLAGVGGTNWVFVDAMKMAREWTSINDKDRYAGQFSYQGNSLLFTNRQYEWGNGQAISLRPDGYPARLEPWQALITLTVRDVCLHAPAGRYVCTFDGDGELDFGLDAKTVAFQKGRIDVDFTPTCTRECWFDKAGWQAYCSDNGIGITIRRTNPNNPLRNIRLIAPGFFATHHQAPFHPWFVAALAPYSVLRFMDWGHTNSEDVVVTPPDVPAVRFVRLTITAVRDPTATFTAMGNVWFFAQNTPIPVVAVTCAGPCTTVAEEAPELLLDANMYTSFRNTARAAGSVLVFDLGALPVAIDAFAFSTSRFASGGDPVRWTLEGSPDAAAWVLMDTRDYMDMEVTAQRQAVALESMLSSRNTAINNVRIVAGGFRTQHSTNTPLQWNNRVTTDYRTQAAKGVALEYQILLANTVKASAWFCIHHLATNDYIVQMARLVRDTLRPDVLVYIEHSNEVWNTMFPQGQYAVRQGIALGLATQGTACVTSPALRCAQYRWHSQRSVEIFKLWEAAFGGRSRLRFVMGSWTYAVGVTRELLQWKDAAQYTDLVGVTGYLAPSPIDASYLGKTVTQVHDLMTATISSNVAGLQAHATLAKSLGVGCITYEGGPALVQDGVIGGGAATGGVTELLIAANRHPGMETVLARYLAALKQLTPSLASAQAPFMYFGGPAGVFSKYGSWTLQEFTDQPLAEAPKWRALLSFIATETGRPPSPESFTGPPAVTSPLQNDTFVAGQRYELSWNAERVPLKDAVSLELRRLRVPAFQLPIVANLSNVGSYSWTVPADGLEMAGDYVVRVARAAQFNTSEAFWIIPRERAPLSYALFVQQDVDVLSAFHRDCSQPGQNWAVVPHFQISGCTFSSAEGCRSYRTHRTTQRPVAHGNFKPVVDCVLKVVGVRSTLRLEGLTRAFDADAKDAVSMLIASAADVPAASVMLVNVRTVAGFQDFIVGDCRSISCSGRRLLGVADHSAVDIDLAVSANDQQLAQVLTALAAYNQTFADPLKQSMVAMGMVNPALFGFNVGNVTSMDVVGDVLSALQAEALAVGSGCAAGQFKAPVDPYNLTSGFVCTSCAPGSVGTGLESTCQLCAAGRFKAASGTGSCEPCLTALSPGSSSCSSATAAPSSSSLTGADANPVSPRAAGALGPLSIGASAGIVAGVGVVLLGALGWWWLQKRSSTRKKDTGAAAMDKDSSPHPATSVVSIATFSGSATPSKAHSASAPKLDYLVSTPKALANSSANMEIDMPGTPISPHLTPKSHERSLASHQRSETSSSESQQSRTSEDSKSKGMQASSVTGPSVRWFRKLDATRGRYFYVNPTTRESSWTEPAEAWLDLPPAAAATAAWIRKKDASTDKYFYVNVQTKQSTWIEPEGWLDADSMPVASASSTTKSVENPASPWIRKVDTATGRFYFVHTSTKKSSWQVPAEGWR